MNIQEVEQYYIAAREVASLLSVSLQRVRAMGAKHATFPRREGMLFGHTVFNRAAVMAWIAKHRSKQ